MSFKVVNVFGAPGMSFKEGEDLVVKQGGECFLTFCSSEDEIATAAADADAIVGVFTGGTQTLSAKTIEKLTRLKHISNMGIGYEGIDLKAATANGVCVSNVPDYCLDEMADHTIMLLLVLARKLLPTIDAVRELKWNAGGRHTILAEILPPVFRLGGQTLGLIGFGHIPRAVVPRAKALKLRVIAYDPYISADTMRKFDIESTDMDTLLAKSDYVSLHAALTETNKHMISLSQFQKMKNTAFFINTARGGLVDERALYTALTSGIIAGAAVDVLDPEPPASDSPLLRLPNLIATPHVANYSCEAQSDITRMPYEEACRVLCNAWPRDIAFCNPEVKDKFIAKWGAKQT
ncbi:C-terminal binding protein [Chloroflexota bacterium]